MQRSPRNALWACLLVCLLGSIVGAFGAVDARTVTVAVVSDGPVADRDIVPMIETELGLLVEPGTNVVFKEAPEFDANWDPARIRGVITNALGDPDVDYLLVTGLLTAQGAAAEDLELTKPVLVGTGLLGGVSDGPTGKSWWRSKKNLNFTLIPLGLAEDVRVFHRMIPFDRAYFVIDKVYVERFELIPVGIRAVEDDLGVTIDVLTVADNVLQAFSGLDESVEVVLLGASPRMAADERRELIEGFTARGMPVFSLVGHPDVRLGALAALLPDLDPVIARRVAVNLNELIRGAATDDLPATLPIDPALLVNGRTAAAVGYSPTSEERISSEFIYGEALDEPETPLTFVQALEEAEKGNTALTVKDAEVDKILQEQQIARSPLLPQIGASGSYDAREPGPLEGVLPDQVGIASVSLRQMIYDDRAVSDYRSSKRIFDAVQYDREAARLDVLAGAGTSFLEFVLARVFLQIQVANVGLTKDNLDLAKVRYQAGYSGQDEVFRWEAELAGRRQVLLSTRTLVEAARVEFNQVLGVDQDRRWRPEEVDVDPEVLGFLDGRVDPIFKDARQIEKLRRFMVEFSFDNSPELMFLAKAVESEEIQLAQRRRSFFLPTFSALFSYDYYVHRNPDIPSELDKAIYGVRIEASYPIFNGAARLYDKRRSQAVVEGLTREEKFTREIVERRTRKAFHAVENSFPAIKFAEIEADNSRKNLVIVQEKYAQGIVNVTDLLEAQTQAFNAEQNAAAAVYSFLADLVELQRAIAWFEYDKTPEEKDELLARIQKVVVSP